MNIYKFDFEKLTPEELEGKDIMEYIHHCLFEVTVNEGSLICPGCAKEYTIKDGIPNLVLLDDEV